MQQYARSSLFALLFLTLIGPTPARAQAPGARIHGIVTTAEGNAPLAGVSVEIVDLDRRTRTGPGGTFTFVDLPIGSHTVRFDAPGRRERREMVTLPATGDTRLVIELEKGPLHVLDRIQVTATRTPRSSFEIPAPVAVIDRERIERIQASKPGNLFPLQPGLEVVGAGPFLGLPAIRGLSGNRVLLLVDGQRLNNSREAVNFGGVQPALVDMGQIDEIEVTRGPASVLYGTDAIGGIINIVTRKPPVPESGVLLGGTVTPRYRSTGDERAGHVQLYAASPHLSLLLDGAVRDADNFDSARGEVLNSAAETTNLTAALDWHPGNGSRILAEVQRFRGHDIGIPGAVGVFTGSFPETTRDKLGLRYDGTGFGTWFPSLQTGFYVQDQKEEFATLLDLPAISAGPFDLLIDTETSRTSDVRTVGFDVQTNRPIGSRQFLTYGVEFFRDRAEEARRESSTREFVPQSPGPPGRTETVVDSFPTTPDGVFQGLGVFLQDEFRADRLTLIPGVRFDRFDIDVERLERPEGAVPAKELNESAVSASVGLLYRLSDEVQASATAGRSFRTPNLIERFFFGPGSQGGLSVPNPNLDNETSLNVEAGLKVRTAGVNGSVSVFRNRIDEFITFVPATFMGDSTFGGRPISTVDNVDEVRILGIEADIEGRMERSNGVWSAFGAFTWNDGENLSDDMPLLVPPVKLVFGGGWAPPGGWGSAGATVRLVGRQEDVPSNFEETAGFTVVSVHGALDLSQLAGAPLRLRGRIENLGDKAYQEPLNASLSPGRTLVVSLDYSFETKVDR